MDDESIIHLYFLRDEEAIRQTDAAYGRRLLALASRILLDPQDAEEAVNDTYLAVWDAIPPKKPDPLAGFVYKTGRNISLDRLKYNTAEKRDGRYDVSIDELANCIPAPALEQTVDAKELGAAINRFLGTLSADNRALFLRRYWFGDSVREIARDLNLRQNAASVRLSRMRTQLRTHLIKEGYVDE